MTETEIIREYKEAKKKNAQIQILAELNCVDPKEIRAILQKAGVYQKPGPKTGSMSEQKEVPPAPKKKPAATINKDFDDAVNEMIEESKPVIEAADPVPGELGYAEIIPNSETELPMLPKEPEPPQGLKPRELAERMFNESRIRDIVAAMHRYYEADMGIPEAWRFELKDRL